MGGIRFQDRSQQSVIQYEYPVDSKSITSLFTFLKDTVKPKIHCLNLTSYLICVGVKDRNTEIKRRYIYSSFLSCGLVSCLRTASGWPASVGISLITAFWEKGRCGWLYCRRCTLWMVCFNHSLLHILKFGLQPWSLREEGTFFDSLSSVSSNFHVELREYFWRSKCHLVPICFLAKLV